MPLILNDAIWITALTGGGIEDNDSDIEGDYNANCDDYSVTVGKVNDGDEIDDDCDGGDDDDDDENNNINAENQDDDVMSLHIHSLAHAS